MERSNEISSNFRSGEVRNFVLLWRNLESATKFRQIFALEVCEISKGETNLRSKCVRNFERLDESSFKMRANFRFARESYSYYFCPTRSSERFGNKHLASDLTRAKQSSFPCSKK